ncbi:MAG: FHA domain-containing protein [Gammaproteobacteria bacterium]|nr:FHA domain-containing protein [Gammaproteobacteria bacterium]
MAALIQFANGAPGIKYPINKSILTIGRETADNDICVVCAFVSKHHAVLEVVENITADGYDFYLQDLHSTNHTYVNDQPIERIRLEDGDIVRLGKALFKFDSNLDPVTIAPTAVDIDVTDIPVLTNSVNFSRRLRVFGVDA